MSSSSSFFSLVSLALLIASCAHDPSPAGVTHASIMSSPPLSEAAPQASDPQQSGSSTVSDNSNGRIDPPHPLEGLPPIESLRVLKPGIFDSQYPGSNDPNMRRVATEFHQPSLLQLELPEDATPSPTVMRFVGPVEGLVIQGEDAPAFGDMDGLIAWLTRDAKNDREKAEALFFFVRDVVKDWWYPAQGHDLTVEDLNTLIWGFGYGYCYDLGRLMAGLWAQGGFRSRIVGWPQHTVAEVFYDGAWHLYDLQHHSFYEKPDGQVASFAELKAEPKLFYQNLNIYGLDAINYPPHHMEHWYGIAHPVFEDSTEGGHWSVERDFRIDLREGELLDIYWSEPGPTYHPNSWVVYYGLKTTRKDSPTPMNALLEYSPARFIKDGKMAWEEVQTPEGKRGWAVDMRSPFMFTEGMVQVPGGAHIPHGWVEVHGRTHYLGRLSHGTAHLSKYIAGANHFRLILQTKDDMGVEEANLHKTYFRTFLNLSPIGLPKLKGGVNKIPFRFKSGHAVFSLWFRDHAPDLTLSDFEVRPANPKPGEYAEIIYTVTNQGSGQSQPTSLSVFNNVTAFLSETTRKVAVQTVPPLNPGESTQISVFWRASTEMTWYGQNPYVQLIDAWLDIEKDTPDVNRDDNRRQDHILLKQEDGTLPELPGYRKLPGTH